MSIGTILLFLLVVFLILIVALVAVGIWAFTSGKRHIYRLLKPNPNDIRRDLERLHRLYPNEPTDALADRVIRQSALILGGVGGLCGFGGGFTMIIGIPLDISVATLRQMKMVHIITALYGNDDLDSDILEIKYMSLVLGSAGASRFITFVVLLLLGDLIPGLGVLLGAGINWFFTKSIGEAAIAWNKGESLRERGRGKIQELKDKAANLTGAARQRINLNSQQPLSPALNSGNDSYAADIPLENPELVPQLNTPKFIYSIDGKQYGPHSREVMLDYFRAGVLSPDDSVWNTQTQKWEPLSNYISK